MARRDIEFDADHIGVWGSSYSGGHVLVVSALDRRGPRCPHAIGVATSAAVLRWVSAKGVDHA